MERLQELSEALASCVREAERALVRVEARRRLPASGALWSSQGVIVTAHHVVEREEGIQVGLPGGEKLEAELVGRDPRTDLAVLRIPAKDLPVPRWVEEEEHQVGHLVLALGRPGEHAMATLGIVSATGGRWRTPAGGDLEGYLQTDVVMYPGFSGGLLVSASGGALGINTSALVRGVSMTVTAVSLRRLVPMLLEHGVVRRGYLGVGLQPVRLPTKLAEEAGQETGVLITHVEANSAAERGGLVLGDTLLAFAGERVRVPQDLIMLLGEERVGAKASVKVLRGGQLQELQVTVGAR
jgi:S1-C subfamily serine protease